MFIFVIQTRGITPQNLEIMKTYEVTITKHNGLFERETFNSRWSAEEYFYSEASNEDNRSVYLEDSEGNELLASY